MIQEVKPGFHASSSNRTLPVIELNKDRSTSVGIPETLPPLHIFHRVGPKFPDETIFTSPEANKEVYSKCIEEYRVWVFARVAGSSGQRQIVPSFGGFISAG